jgi:hypothetical protein
MALHSLPSTFYEPAGVEPLGEVLPRRVIMGFAVGTSLTPFES